MTNSQTRLNALENYPLLKNGVLAGSMACFSYLHLYGDTIRKALQENMGDCMEISGITLGEKLQGKITEDEAIELVNSVIRSQDELMGDATPKLCERTDCWLDEKCNGMEGELVEALGNIVDHWSTGGTTQHWLDDLNKATKILDKYRSRKK